MQTSKAFIPSWQTKDLMTIGIVGKDSTDNHSVQKVATTCDFLQHSIVLHCVWINGPRPIKGLTLRKHFTRPPRQFVVLISDKLESISICLGGRGFSCLAEFLFCSGMIFLSPRPAHSQTIRDHGSNG